MKLAANQLMGQVQGTLAPVYVVSGDEPLLVQEACDTVLSAAFQQGFVERLIFTVETGFDWAWFAHEQQSLSLFSSKRVLDLRFSQKPNETANQFLMAQSLVAKSDDVFLIRLPKLDATAQKQAWVKSWQSAPLVQWIAIWPLEPQQWLPWVTNRCQKKGLNIHKSAIQELAHRVEGNPLAAIQEIEKMDLLYGNAAIDIEQVKEAVGQCARHDPFQWVDTLLLGRSAEALSILHALKSEGVEPVNLLWLLAKEVRLLLTVHQQVAMGTSIEQVLRQRKPPIWDKRQTLYRSALQRGSVRLWRQLLQKLQITDAQIKGQAQGDAWVSITLIALMLSGTDLGLPINDESIF